VGKSKVFFSGGLLEGLEDRRSAARAKAATLLQVYILC
jgi:myosin heavy subunit